MQSCPSGQFVLANFYWEKKLRKTVQKFFFPVQSNQEMSTQNCAFVQIQMSIIWKISFQKYPLLLTECRLTSSRPQLMDMFLLGKYNIIWIGVLSQWWVKNINLWLWVPSELSAAEAWNGQIKQSWRGNDSAPNQIYVRRPQREIDVLSDAEDFNSLCYNTDKQSAFCLESISLIVSLCVCVSRFMFCLGFSLLCVLCA